MLRENHRGRPCVPGVLDEARIPTTLLYSRRDGGQAIIRDTDGSAVISSRPARKPFGEVHPPHVTIATVAPSQRMPEAGASSTSHTAFPSLVRAGTGTGPHCAQAAEPAAPPFRLPSPLPAFPHRRCSLDSTPGSSNSAARARLRLPHVASSWGALEASGAGGVSPEHVFEPTRRQHSLEASWCPQSGGNFQAARPMHPREGCHGPTFSLERSSEEDEDACSVRRRYVPATAAAAPPVPARRLEGELPLAPHPPPPPGTQGQGPHACKALPFKKAGASGQGGGSKAADTSRPSPRSFADKGAGPAARQCSTQARMAKVDREGKRWRQRASARSYRARPLDGTAAAPGVEGGGRGGASQNIHRRRLSLDDTCQLPEAPRARNVVAPPGDAKERRGSDGSVDSGAETSRGGAAPRKKGAARAVVKGLSRARPAHPSHSGMQRGGAAGRYEQFCNVVDRYTSLQTATHVPIGGGVVINVKDLNELKHIFLDMAGPGNVYVDQDAFDRKIFEVNRLLEQKNEELGVSDEDIQKILLQYQAFGFTTTGVGRGAKFTGSIVLNCLKTGFKLSWKGFLRLLYPTANKEGIDKLVEIRTKAKILTNDQLHDLEHLWQQWDIDGNGVVDKKEFTRGLIKLGLDPQKTDAIYTAVDTNCNGTISQDEFAAWYCTDKVASWVTRILTIKEQQDLKDLWHQWDPNQEGSLTRKEFSLALESLNVPRDEIDTIYEEVDVDRNGVISEAEFSNWFFAEECRGPQMVMGEEDFQKLLVQVSASLPDVRKGMR